VHEIGAHRSARQDLLDAPAACAALVEPSHVRGEPLVIAAQKLAHELRVTRQPFEGTARVDLSECLIVGGGRGDSRAHHERVVDEPEIFEPVRNQIERFEQTRQSRRHVPAPRLAELGVLQEPGQRTSVVGETAQPIGESVETARVERGHGATRLSGP
jgi:hypothetical protein